MCAFALEHVGRNLKELISKRRAVYGGSSEDSELILNYEEKAFD
jgi:hypothetical protein